MCTLLGQWHHHLFLFVKLVWSQLHACASVVALPSCTLKRSAYSVLAAEIIGLKLLELLFNVSRRKSSCKFTPGALGSSSRMCHTTCQNKENGIQTASSYLTASIVLDCWVERLAHPWQCRSAESKDKNRTRIYKNSAAWRGILFW